MPRTARAVRAGVVYHVLNRGNGGVALFHKPADFDAFARVLAEALARHPVDLFRLLPGRVKQGRELKSKAPVPVPPPSLFHRPRQ